MRLEKPGVFREQKCRPIKRRGDETEPRGTEGSQSLSAGYPCGPQGPLKLPMNEHQLIVLLIRWYKLKRAEKVHLSVPLIWGIKKLAP